MRVQCDVCERALAEVVCCADEAALCLSCDQRVHAANKLASKHQRLRLLHNLPPVSSPLPLCDICQEKGAFIFCLEDRALVCRNCDVCIHAVNTLAAGHQRFLATGVQVALESEKHPADDGSNPAKPQAPRPQPPPSSTVHGTNPACTSCSSSCSPPSTQRAGNESMGTNVRGSAEIVAKQGEEWHNTQILDLADLAPDYPLSDLDFSKTDIAALGDQDWFADICGFNECLHAESLAEVPQAAISNFSAAAPGLELGIKGKQRREILAPVQDFDSISVVPDLRPFASHAPLAKRQKSVFGI